MSRYRSGTDPRGKGVRLIWGVLWRKPGNGWRVQVSHHSIFLLFWPKPKRGSPQGQGSSGLCGPCLAAIIPSYVFVAA